MTRTRKLLAVILVLAAALSMLPCAFVASAETQKYYIGGKAIETDLDKGYTGNKEIKSGDPHYGWDIGRFYVENFTSILAEGEYRDCPVILKTVGDEVALKFELLQDINCLNGNSKFKITSDKQNNTYFGIPKTDFGHGVVIIRHTDYQNNVSDPQIYVDFFNGNNVGDNLSVKLCEEGDYEVALNYEIESPGVVPLTKSYHNYRIFFKFSVRNGNCMVYPRDAKTGAELNNASMTKNGFYLDLAKSRYLDINIKKQVWVDGVFGLVEDTRFNKPAKDGETFTDWAMYIITVKNRYTKETTTKEIYVGQNRIVAAHIVTGYSFEQIKELMERGATIYEDGTIEMPPDIEPEPEPEPEPSSEPSEPSRDETLSSSESTSEELASADDTTSTESSEANGLTNNSLPIVFIGVIIGVIIAVGCGTTAYSRHKKKNDQPKTNGGNDQ